MDTKQLVRIAARRVCEDDAGSCPCLTRGILDPCPESIRRASKIVSEVLGAVGAFADDSTELFRLLGDDRAEEFCQKVGDALRKKAAEARLRGLS